jgi:hypothetical protein
MKQYAMVKTRDFPYKIHQTVNNSTVADYDFSSKIYIIHVCVITMCANVSIASTFQLMNEFKKHEHVCSASLFHTNRLLKSHMKNQ